MKTCHIHITDIFHPHGDPDDHYDLALAFALHRLGLLRLEHVVMDYPPAHRVGDPALCAVAQLNEITGCTVPASVAPKDEELAGQRLCGLMAAAPLPVTFTVVGSSESIAAAIRQQPELFREKCAGIYLAAGTGVESPGGMLEYNVRLHPSAYTTVLTAPCPVYWAPCYHTILADAGDSISPERGGPYGSVFCIYQKELLTGLPPVVQNYFLYMLTRSEDPKYLRYLDGPVDAAALEEKGGEKRRLWSTPLLLHAAGLFCNSWSFHPVELECGQGGRVMWTPAEESRVQIFRRKDPGEVLTDTFDTDGLYRMEMLYRLRDALAALPAGEPMPFMLEIHRLPEENDPVGAQYRRWRTES